MMSATDFKNKVLYVDECIKQWPVDTILDVGCGQGHYARHFIEQRYEVTGLEYSEICCNKYLQDIPHVCGSIIDYIKEPQPFDAIICIDVLEHLEYNEISAVLEGFTKISDRAVLGIANHSDILDDVELHVIQQPLSWWVGQIVPYYKNLSIKAEMYDGRFFIIQVWK